MMEIMTKNLLHIHPQLERMNGGPIASQNTRLPAVVEMTEMGHSSFSRTNQQIANTIEFGEDMMKHFMSCLLLVLMITGCAPSRHQLTVDEYVAAAPKVSLGMLKEEVIEILKPSQQRQKNTEIKHSDIYDKEGVLVEILYFRSGWQHDGLTTDDEFTPYLFNDGKLVAVGWAVLGGPKSQGQATSETKVYGHRTWGYWPGIIVY